MNDTRAPLRHVPDRFERAATLSGFLGASAGQKDSAFGGIVLFRCTVISVNVALDCSRGS